MSFHPRVQWRWIYTTLGGYSIPLREQSHAGEGGRESDELCDSSDEGPTKTDSIETNGSEGASFFCSCVSLTSAEAVV